jgi:hypothetical protein
VNDMGHMGNMTIKLNFIGVNHRCVLVCQTSYTCGTYFDNSFASI